jgi:hypothetical protein
MARNALRTRRVIVDDENPECVRGPAAVVACRGRANRSAGRHCRANGAWRVAAWRDEPHARPLAWRAVDLELAAEQGQSLADAEQSPAHLTGLRALIELCQFKTGALIRHGDAQLVVGVERQLQGDAIRLRVFDRIEQSSLTDSNSSVRTSFRPESARGSATTWTSSLYLSCVQFASHVSAAGSPDCCSTGGNSSKFRDLAAAIASSSWCLASESSSLARRPLAVVASAAARDSMRR